MAEIDTSRLFSLLERIATALEKPAQLSREAKCQRAIGLLHEMGPNVRAIARVMGISEGTLRGWPKFMEKRNALLGLVRGIDKVRAARFVSREDEGEEE